MLGWVVKLFSSVEYVRNIFKLIIMYNFFITSLKRHDESSVMKSTDDDLTYLQIQFICYLTNDDSFLVLCFELLHM